MRSAMIYSGGIFLMSTSYTARNGKHQRRGLSRTLDALVRKSFSFFIRAFEGLWKTKEFCRSFHIPVLPA